jgi:hypothetical protein
VLIWKTEALRVKKWLSCAPGALAPLPWRRLRKAAETDLRRLPNDEQKSRRIQAEENTFLYSSSQAFKCRGEQSSSTPPMRTGNNLRYLRARRLGDGHPASADDNTTLRQTPVPARPPDLTFQPGIARMTTKSRRGKRYSSVLAVLALRFCPAARSRARCAQAPTLKGTPEGT